MHKIEYSILEKFKKDPNKEFSTSELVREVLPKDYENIKENILDQKDVKKIQEKKAKMHRRVLYHLNKLVKDEILEISQIAAHGEKLFKLGFESGDYIIEKKQRKILISKPQLPSMPIQNYEENGLIRKFDPESWLTRLNSILINPDEIKSYTELYNMINKFLSYVNDVITIPDFEKFIEKFQSHDTNNFLSKINIDSTDYNRAICLIINLEKVKDQEKLIEFFEDYSKINPTLIEVIYKLNVKELNKKKKFLEYLIKESIKQKRKINIQNTDISSIPMIIGRAGIYTFLEEEWEQLKNTEMSTRVIACSQLTLNIDIHRTNEKLKNPHAFREMINKSVRALLQANSVQRKYTFTYFKENSVTNSEQAFEFFRISRHYLRFWNYDLSKAEENNIINLMESCKEEVDEFCKTEDIIYKSCGIPIRFKVAFSSKFTKLDSEKYSDRKYHKSTIRTFNDLITPEFKEMIKNRERLLRVFEGSDRVRLFRSGEYTTDDIIKEFQHLLINTSLPLICYDFAPRKEIIKLTQFM